MNKHKVLICGDGQGWIVDGIVYQMMELMSDKFEFIRRDYTRIATEELIEIANSSDLTYYANSDFSYHLGAEHKITKPFLLGIRSHRYPSFTKDLAKVFNTHVCNPMLLKDFPNATYIPDGVFVPNKKEFTVGMVFQEMSREYKGYWLVKQACEELGCNLRIATGKENIIDFYNSVDLVVIASIAEGFNTIAMECMALNKPFITTDVGIPHLLNCHKTERQIDNIKTAIGKFYTSPQVKDYNWIDVCNQFSNLFERLAYGGTA